MKSLEKKNIRLKEFLKDNLCFKSKSFISLNPFYGCSVGCAYCYRLSHKSLFNVFKRPERFATDEETIELLKSKKELMDSNYPISLHDYYKYPFLPETIECTISLVKLIKNAGIKKKIVIISKVPIAEEIIKRLIPFKDDLIIMYGFSNLPTSFESPNKDLKKNTLKSFSKYKFTVFIHFRPLIPSFNDSLESIEEVLSMVESYATGVIIGGIQFSKNVRKNIENRNIDLTLRESDQKYLSEEMLEKINLIKDKNNFIKPVLFHNSCAVTYAMGFKKNYTGITKCDCIKNNGGRNGQI